MFYNAALELRGRPKVGVSFCANDAVKCNRLNQVFFKAKY